MANMSYCRFQNTETDLRDCLYAMETEDTFADMDLSNEEADALIRMKQLCEEFLENYERLQYCPIDEDNVPKYGEK